MAAANQNLRIGAQAVLRLPRCLSGSAAWCGNRFLGGFCHPIPTDSIAARMAEKSVRSGKYSMSAALVKALTRAAMTPGVVRSASSMRMAQEEQCMFLMRTRIDAVPAL